MAKIRSVDAKRRILRGLFFVFEAAALTLYLVGPRMWSIIEERTWSWIFLVVMAGLFFLAALLRRTDRGLSLIGFVTFGVYYWVWRDRSAVCVQSSMTKARETRWARKVKAAFRAARIATIAKARVQIDSTNAMETQPIPTIAEAMRSGWSGPVNIK